MMKNFVAEIRKSVTFLLVPTIVTTLLLGLYSFDLGQLQGQEISHAQPPNVVRVRSAVVKIADAVTVPAEYAGVLMRVVVTEGQAVKAGDLIAKIDDSELRLRLDRAKFENEIAIQKASNDIDIRFAKKSNELAQSEVDRSIRSNVRVDNSVAQGKLERQQLEVEKTLLQAEQAERDFKVEALKTKITKNELALSELLLKKTEIRAPIDGRIKSIERRQGEWVEPSEAVVGIVRVDRLRVEGFVPVEYASLVKIGAPVEVKFSQAWLQGKQYKGRVVFVSLEANPVNSEILVWAEILNEGSLVPGMRGEILIQTQTPVENTQLGSW